MCAVSFFRLCVREWAPCLCELALYCILRSQMLVFAARYQRCPAPTSPLSCQSRHLQGYSDVNRIFIILTTSHSTDRLSPTVPRSFLSGASYLGGRGCFEGGLAWPCYGRRSCSLGSDCWIRSWRCCGKRKPRLEFVELVLRRGEGSSFGRIPCHFPWSCSVEDSAFFREWVTWWIAVLRRTSSRLCASCCWRGLLLAKH